MTRDSGSRPTGRDVKQARGEARQSGGDSRIAQNLSRACPFCNAPKDDFGGMVPEAFARCIETGTFAMGCSRCNTTGPMMPSMEEAITAWNTRSPEVVTVGEAVEALRRLSGEASDHLTGFAGEEPLNAAIRSADELLVKIGGDDKNALSKVALPL